LINLRKDGSLYTEETTITPVRGADGRITHFVAIKQDVTERRQLDSRLQQAQKMEAIGRLAGGIAHDFNNILAAMFGFTYLLEEETAANPAAQEEIKEILKAANRAKDLVQQILTFSQQREQKREIIWLDTVVKEAAKLLRASLPAQIKIDLKLMAEAPPVLADPTQIYQVTMNLATNAQHAMGSLPGTLTIHLGTFRPDGDFLQSHPDFQPIQYAQLTVADTGCGMDEKTQARIYEPFFTTKPVGQGTGLGLAVVHGIMQSQGGLITVDSRVGQGTTFKLYFPAQRAATVTAETAKEKVPRGQKQKILLVDDEVGVTLAFKRLLEELNYQVTCSNQALAAVELLRQSPAGIDLVITDLTMPEMNGLELARQIHALRPDLPIILTSGFASEFTEDDLRQAGICELLQKPVSRAALAEAAFRALVAAKS
jgi:signal transduction histidine kinase/ActR/RegA family two-component response regulator